MGGDVGGDLRDHLRDHLRGQLGSRAEGFELRNKHEQKNSNVQYSTVQYSTISNVPYSELEGRRDDERASFNKRQVSVKWIILLQYFN